MGSPHVPADWRAGWNVVAVVVTYFPDRATFFASFQGIRQQVDAIALVDNGSPAEVQQRLEGLAQPHVAWIPLGDNLGVARAQNIGINWARDHGATHVILCDQDSEPHADMVSRLLCAAEKLRRRGIRLAAAVPAVVDSRQPRLKSFSRLGRLWATRFGCDPGEDMVQTDTAIASGSLIPMTSLAEIGGMREELFVDLVDIEWFLRARALGYRSFGVCDAVLRHRLGAEPRSFAGRKVAHHSALRTYYFYRNAVWLCQQGYVPTAWKLAVTRQLLWRWLYYPLAVAPRWDYLRMMTLGVRHGLRDRLGRLDLLSPTAAGVERS